MALPPALGIRHIALFVDDLERSEAFYRGVLGYEVEWRPDPDNLYLTMGGRDNLALHKGGAGRASARLDHFGVALREAADVDAWHAHLEAAGAVIVRGPQTHRDGARSFYAKDPDGTVLQFLHHPRIGDRA